MAAARPKTGKLTQDEYDRLTEAYRARPGSHWRAAGVTGLDPSTARKYWLGKGRSNPFPAIKDVLAGTVAAKAAREEARFAAELRRDEAKAAAQQEQVHQRTQAAAEQLREVEERRREMAEEADRLDGQTLRVLRSNTLGAIASQARVIQASMKAGERIAKMLETGQDAQGNPVDMTPGQWAQLTNRLASTNRLLALAAESIATVDSIRQEGLTKTSQSAGEVGLDGAVTWEELSQELKHTQEAVARVRGMGADNIPLPPGATSH